MNNIADTNIIERQKQNLNHLKSGTEVGNNLVYGPTKEMHNADTYTEIKYQHQKESDSIDSPDKNSTLYNNSTKPQKNADMKFLQVNNSSDLKINEVKFENSENNFNEEAPELPYHLLNIPFLSVCNLFLLKIIKLKKKLLF